MNKKILAFLVVFLMIAQQFPGIAEAHYADNTIKAWQTKGYLTGINVKNPDRKITKKEVTQILNKVVGGGVTISSDTATITRENTLMEIIKAFRIQPAGAVNAVTKYKDFDSITPANRLYVEQAILENMIVAPDGKMSFYPKAPMKIGDFIILMDRIVGKRIDKSGTYSYYYETANNQFNNILIRSGNVTIENANIRGNIYISPSAGRGDITLRDVNVGGRVVVLGGDNDLRLENTTIAKLHIEKNKGELLTYANGTSQVKAALIRSDAKLIERFHTEKGFQNVTVGGKGAYAKVDFDGEFDAVTIDSQSIIELRPKSTFKTFTVNESGKNSSIRASEGTQISKMILNDFATPLYDGKIAEVNITQKDKRVQVQGQIEKINLYASATVDIQRGSEIGQLIIGPRAMGSTVYLDENVKVKTLDVQAQSDIIGDGQVEVAKVYAKNVTISREVGALELSKAAGSVSIGGKAVSTGKKLPNLNTSWNNYRIRTLTNGYTVPTGQDMRLYLRQERSVDYVDEDIQWTVDSGKGVIASYINPYTGVLNAKGEGIVYVTASSSADPTQKTVQKIYVGTPLGWTGYPFVDPNVYTGLSITAGPESISASSTKDMEYQYKATTVPSQLKASQVVWGLETLAGNPSVTINDQGILTVATGSDKGTLRLSAWIADQPGLIAQKILRVNGGVALDSKLIQSIYINSGNQVGETGKLDITPGITPKNKDTEDKFTWDIEILDGRFLEYPYMDKNTLYAMGKGRMLLTMRTTDGSDLIRQKVITVDNVTFNDITGPEVEPAPEHSNEYYETEQGLSIKSSTGAFVIRSVSGQLRLSAVGTGTGTPSDIRWDVEMIDGNMYYYNIDETGGILTASGKGRLVVTASGTLNGVELYAKKVVEVGKPLTEDEKPTEFVTLRNAAKDHPSNLKSGQSYTMEAIDINDKKVTGLTYVLLEKEDTLTSVTVSPNGYVRPVGEGTFTIQAYGEKADGTLWYMGYETFAVSK